MPPPPTHTKIYLGMDPDEDEDFLWIAKEALFAAVPEVRGTGISCSYRY